MQTPTGTLAAALAALLLAVAAVASGCGSASSADDGVAALDNASVTTTDAEREEEADEDPEEAALAWAKCMREHGVDVPDPEFGDGGTLTIRPGSGGRRLDRIDSDAFRKAEQACGRPFGRSGPPALSADEREEMQEAMLAFAECMREHGIDMPDPEFSGGGGRMAFRARAAGGGVDPRSDAFREAQEQCGEILEDTLPRRGGRLGRTEGGESE